MKFINLKKYFISLFLISTTLFGSQALAHKLSVFAYAEGYDVHLEGYFADGKRAQNSKVEVFDPTGKLLVEGKTGKQGEYRFTAPKVEDLKIVINAGMGHRGVYLLHADEIGDGTVEAGMSPEVAVTTPVQQDVAEAQTTEPANNSTSQLERVVHQAVNKAIKPLVRELDESRQKASLTSIVGAIGYIFGFMGLFAFFKSRQLQQGDNKQ